MITDLVVELGPVVRNPAVAGVNQWVLPPAEPLLRAEAVELITLLRRREIGALELLQCVLDRADEIAPDVNPFAIRLDAAARAAAREADRLLATGDGGPLTGLPVSAKDSQWLAGVPTTSGSLARADFVPTHTVGGLQRVIDAGAVIWAKTTTSEFCYFGRSQAPAFGVTANPHNITRTAGGSSGGAAAQVAAWAGPVALGGDGGGSIRIPAAFCGVVGYKPSFGLVGHEPSAAGWKTLVSVGPITRSVADAALLMDVLDRADDRDRHSIGPTPVDDGRPIRFAVSEDLGYAAVDETVRQAFRRAVAALRDRGADVVEAHPGLTSSVRTWALLATAEARWSEAAEYDTKPELLSSEVRDYLAFGETISAADYIGAQFERERIHAAYAEFFERTAADVLLTPTVGCVAFDSDRSHPGEVGGVPVDELWLDWAPFLYDANLAGLPACAVPAGLDPAGLPISLQVLGPRRSDQRVLRAAAVLSAAIQTPIDVGLSAGHDAVLHGADRAVLSPTISEG